MAYNNYVAKQDSYLILLLGCFLLQVMLTTFPQARERDASAVEKRLGMEMSQALKNIIEPFFLRRTKAQVAKDNEKMEDRTDCLK